jgi:MSHA pilin protein MshA
MNKSGTAGFTLIELIVVITIIAILAAVALPRLIDAQRDAKIAKANAIFGSMRSASALARSRCELDLAQGGATSGCGASPSVVNMDGVNVTMTHRYPTADAAGIDVAAALSLAVDGFVATGGGPGAGATRTFDVIGATTPSSCRISYQAATRPDTNIVAPVITVVTTGC